MCIGAFARDPRRREIQLRNERLHAVVTHRRRVRIECVGLDDIGPGVEKPAMDVLDQLRLRDRQQVVVAFEILFPGGEALAAEIVLAEAVALNHRAHRTVKQDNAALEQIEQGLNAVSSLHDTHFRRQPASAARRGRGRSRM